MFENAVTTVNLLTRAELVPEEYSNKSGLVMLNAVSSDRLFVLTFPLPLVCC